MQKKIKISCFPKQVLNLTVLGSYFWIVQSALLQGLQAATVTLSNTESTRSAHFPTLTTFLLLWFLFYSLFPLTTHRYRYTHIYRNSQGPSQDDGSKTGSTSSMTDSSKKVQLLNMKVNYYTKMKIQHCISSCIIQQEKKTIHSKISLGACFSLKMNLESVWDVTIWVIF